jgi:hypothetical protein
MIFCIQLKNHFVDYRNAFIIWKTSWEHQVHYREEIEAHIRHKILSTSLSCWRDNVAVLKRRREAAVVFLQRVLVRHSLHGWKNYTQHKKQLRCAKFMLLTNYTFIHFIWRKKLAS